MSALLLDRVLETTTTTGTGTINLAGAQTGYNAFRDEADDGATVYYLIVNNPSAPTAWEYGLGTLTYGTPDTLSRDTVIDSSNSGSKITIASGPSYTVLSPGGKDALQPGSEAKTSAYTLTMTDIGKFVSCDASGADFTLTLPAASTATGRYWAFVGNTGASGVVTVDANGAETINGSTTILLAAGAAALLRCDGTEWSAVVSGSSPALAECRLVYTNATTLTLERHNGKYISINGADVEIPSAGVTVGTGGLSSATNYYVYAYVNSGTLTLELSATGYATDSSTGVKIKSGDATRTLVGLVRTNGSTQFSDILTLSYFNRLPKLASASFTANRSTTSGSFTEINTEIRVNVMTWGDEVTRATIAGVHLNAAGDYGGTSIGWDGVNDANFANFAAENTARGSSIGVSGAKILAEGSRYVTLMGFSASGLSQWVAVGGIYPTLTVEIMG